MLVPREFRAPDRAADGPRIVFRTGESRNPGVPFGLFTLQPSDFRPSTLLEVTPVSISGKFFFF